MAEANPRQNGQDGGPASPGQPPAWHNLRKGSETGYGKILQVHYLEDRFIIYETEDRRIVIEGETSILDGKPEIHALLRRVADYTEGFPELKARFNSRRAHAMRLALAGDPASAEAALTETLAKIAEYLSRRARLAYVVGAVAVLAAALAAYWAAWALRLLSPLGARLCASLVFASMGGVMSVTIGQKKLDIDPVNRELTNGFYGALRIVIAMIAGVVSYFVIESGLALTLLRDPTPGTGAHWGGYLIAAFLSGFSEMFIPNIIGRIGEDGGRQAEGPRPDPSHAPDETTPHDAKPDDPAPPDLVPAKPGEIPAVGAGAGAGVAGGKGG